MRQTVLSNKTYLTEWRQRPPSSSPLVETFAAPSRTINGSPSGCSNHAAVLHPSVLILSCNSPWSLQDNEVCCCCPNFDNGELFLCRGEDFGWTRWTSTWPTAGRWGWRSCTTFCPTPSSPHGRREEHVAAKKQDGAVKIQGSKLVQCLCKDYAMPYVCMHVCMNACVYIYWSQQAANKTGLHVVQWLCKQWSACDAMTV